MSNFILEVCVDSVESARNAIDAGANRLEVCANLASGGGTTPSVGLVKCIASKFPKVPLMVMIRPRCGDFNYTSSDLEVMREDIRQFREMGVAGVVFGALNPDGTIDVLTTKSLTQVAIGLQVTFHRAFDMTRDLDEALLQLATISRISRILTSGGSSTVLTSLPQLERLIRAAPSHLTVMPGSGISGDSIHTLVSSLAPQGLREVHMSGGEWTEGRSVWRKAEMGMGVSKEREWDVRISSYEKIRAVRMVLDSMHTV